MAVPGKHLFWIAIIILELVFVYVLWKPIRAHWRPSQRAALTHPAVRKPDGPKLVDPKLPAFAGPKPISHSHNTSNAPRLHRPRSQPYENLLHQSRPSPAKPPPRSRTQPFLSESGS